jgi:hypothetical protein
MAERVQHVERFRVELDLRRHLKEELHVRGGVGHDVELP